MRNLKSVVGMIKDDRGRQTVKVEAGVTLLELHEWLAQRGFELPYAAEIGDATVGSLTSSISKDSGVGEQALTGSLYKAITGVTYVDHLGDLLTLQDSTKPHTTGGF
jgi:FAD/FMN-containing dehydrogenase